jgi:hypothetical protein
VADRTPARVARTLRRGDDYSASVTIPDDRDPDDFTVLAQVRATPDGSVLATFEETRDGRTIVLKLDGETDVRDLPSRCGADLQVWYLKGEDAEVKVTPLAWSFVVEGDYSREEEGS